MKMQSTHEKSSVVMPVLVGGAVGAGIALLLAPKSGKEMRKDLKRFAMKTRNEVEEVIDEGRDLYEEGREVVAKVAKAGKETYEEGRERLEQLMHRKERSLVMPMLASGIIGAGIALLLAPKSGKEVRKDIKRMAENTRDKVVTAIDKGREYYMEATKAMPEAVEGVKRASIHEKEKLRHAA